MNLLPLEMGILSNAKAGFQAKQMIVKVLIRRAGISDCPGASMGGLEEGCHSII